MEIGYSTTAKHNVVKQNANSTTLKAIGNAMRRNPDSIYLTPEKGLHNIFSLKYAFATVCFNSSVFPIKKQFLYYALTGGIIYVLLDQH